LTPSILPINSAAHLSEQKWNLLKLGFRFDNQMLYQKDDFPPLQRRRSLSIGIIEKDLKL
jgi:hypothetical protein